MGIGGWWQWLIVLVIVLLLFGRGKIPELMGDLGKGVRNLKKGLKDDSEEADGSVETAKTVEHKSDEAVTATKQASKES